MTYLSTTNTLYICHILVMEWNETKVDRERDLTNASREEPIN